MTDYVPNTLTSGNPDNPALLLLNSLGTSTYMWTPQLPVLEQHFHVIRMDTRGHGDSATPPGPYSFDDLMGDALGTLDRLGVATASVMGCSLGSMTGLGLGLNAPDRINRIVCAAARADSPEPFRQSWDDRTAVIDAKGVEGLWEGSLGNWLTPAFRAAEPEQVAKMKAEFLKTTDEGYKGCAAALKQLDFLRHLPGMTVPTLFVAGSEDKGAPPAVMQAMAEVTPASTYVEIPDAGHIVNVNAPKAFSDAVTGFLTGS